MTAAGDDADRRAQLVRGVLDMCLLAMLRQQPGHAYELSHRLQQAGLGETSYGTIYPLITRLRRLGLLEERSEPSGSGPPRKVFSLSPQGETALAAWSTQWLQSTHVVANLLVATDVVTPQEVTL
ncbi:PadR family transcriptional regulator [Kineococcus sp. GCM10028916]|uniref:PadR family transcriptional regulator n=1 Tax=Kineococcus sp. GCM10028916 TaxID=3273394 RepID=UPI00364126CA